jgi:hypothetical protein
LSTRDEHDVAEALLAKAGGDEAGLRVLVDHHDVLWITADGRPGIAGSPVHRRDCLPSLSRA